MKHTILIEEHAIAERVAALAEQINQDYERAKGELDALYDEWSEKSERLEGADG